MTTGMQALTHLEAAGLTVTQPEPGRLRLEPTERVTPALHAYAAQWKAVILDALATPLAADPGGLPGTLGDGEQPGPPDRGTPEPGPRGVDAPARATRAGAWDYLRAVVYEVAEGWDALPEAPRLQDDFDRLTRALDAWLVTYTAGGFWPFDREAFDAAGARFRGVAKRVLEDVRARPPNEGHERMDAVTLLEEHAYYDPKVPS